MGVSKEFLNTAKELAKEHGKLGVQEVYLFPDADEKDMRLVEVDKNNPPAEAGTERMRAFSFGRSGTGGFPYRLTIALISPGEKERLGLPNGWGKWDTALKLFPGSRVGKVRRKE